MHLEYLQKVRGMLKTGGWESTGYVGVNTQRQVSRETTVGIVLQADPGSQEALAWAFHALVYAKGLGLESTAEDPAR